MDRAQTRTAVVLVALLALVAGVLWWQGRPEVEEGGGEATTPVWTVDPATVVRIELERASGRVVLAKDGEAWRVLAPEEGRAESRRIEDLARQLSSLDRAIPVEATGSAAFGLADPPETRVSWTDGDGKVSTLDVGIRAPAAYRVYVRTADGGVGAATGDPTALLTAPVSSFLDQRLFAFDPAEVRAVRVTTGGHVLEVTGADRTWHVTGYGRADPERVDDLVSDLRDLRFDEVRDGLAVDASVATVEVTLADGSVEVAVLGEGEGRGLPARGPDGRTGKVFAQVRDLLSRGPTDVGQRTAFQLRPDLAERVVAEGWGKRLEAVRGEGGWSAAALEPAAVYDLLTCLSTVPVARTLDPAPSSPSPPEATVTFHEPPAVEGGAPLDVSFAVGPLLADGTRAVRDPAGPGPGVRVPADALTACWERLP